MSAPALVPVNNRPTTLAAAEMQRVLRRRVAQVAERREVRDDRHAADAARQVLEADRTRQSPVRMTQRREAREAQVGDAPSARRLSSTERFMPMRVYSMPPMKMPAR